MLSGAGGSSPALHPEGRRSSDDRPSCLENPRPAGAESTLTENVASPFQAEPRQNDLPIIERHWRGYAERLANVAWVSWLVPLAIFEVILQTRRIWHRQSAN